MQDGNSQFATIETSELTDVTGGGWISGAIKLARKAAPFVEKALPVIKDKAVDAAKWTGIPAAIGSGAAWVKHQFDH